MDHLQIEILEDGTIKTTSDKVSAANHQSAEAFLADVTKLTGGKMKRARRGDAHTHSHHGQEHHHEH